MRLELEELRALNADLEATHLLPKPNTLQDLWSSLCLTAWVDRFLATRGEISNDDRTMTESTYNTSTPLSLGVTA